MGSIKVANVHFNASGTKRMELFGNGNLGFVNTTPIFGGVQFSNTISARASIGLNNVDNTSDSTKPISIATQNALNTKAALAHTHSIANVTNLQTTLDSKANTASPVFSGAMTGTHTMRWGASMQPSETDWNNVLTSGFYMKNSMTNSPDGSANWFYVLVQQHAATHVVQTAWSLTNSVANPKCYIRPYVASTWGAWQEIFHTGNTTASKITNDSAVTGANVAAALVTLNTALATKANTASPVFSGAMTGTHTLQWGDSVTGGTVDLDTLSTSGFYSAAPSSGGPSGSSEYFHILTFGSTNKTQIAISVSAPVRMFIRHFFSSAWGAWVQIFHTGNAATSAQFRTGTSSTVPLVPSSVWADNGVITPGETLAVDFSTGFDFGTLANAVFELAANRTLGAPSNIKTGQKGVLWLGATGGTRTLTLNAAWLLMDGVEVGPYSITTSQLLGLAYVTRGSVVYVTAILRRAA